MPTPSDLWLIAGTGTDVGKTWVATALIHSLTSVGRRVAVRKPVQSFDPSDSSTDADVLAAASGEPVEAVCPRERWYERAMAPPMAAKALGRPAFTIADLVDTLRWPSRPADIGLVESAGGVRSPLAIDGDTVDLADALRPNLIALVADAGLGTINAVRLAAAALEKHPVVVVVLNRYDEADVLHQANRDWLTGRDRLDVVVDIDALTRRAGERR